MLLYYFKLTIISYSNRIDFWIFFQLNKIQNNLKIKKKRRKNEHKIENKKNKIYNSLVTTSILGPGSFDF